ncbi:transcriptional regulator [Rhizobiales bacterium GAS191]|nr:transcriptional regulator [Rhizobiales bacterium GAS113]SEE08842.1 transcriptional regulator [Rhizobiales bacterium GAS191]SEE45287.1 transcriptional regulator [Rhizobiales bacterium GAS188]
MAKKTPNLIDRHVGSRLRMRRVLMGMSQEKLGDHLGVTFQQVQKYEKGMNRIGASRLQNASRALEVPVEFFFRDAPQFDVNDPTPNLSSAADSNFVADFLSSNEGVELNQAFVRIKDRKLRRRIVELVRAAAGVDESELKEP